MTRTALIDHASGERLSYGEMGELRAQAGEALAGRGRLVFHFSELSVRNIALFRAFVDAGAAVALLDAGGNPQHADALIARYQPDLIVSTSDRSIPDSYHRLLDGVHAREGEPTVVHPDLSILLSTSGSTGSPKFVRLSRDNVSSNTAQIIDSLSLTADDVAITTLPLHYSYGMSVINTHLAVTGTVVVNRASVFEPSFWTAVAAHGVTSISGVPSMYPMLRRSGLDKRDLPRLRALTQAGGKLSVEEIQRFADLMAARGGEMFVMYGQTEAAPRITCRSVSKTPDKTGSVGRALIGGVLRVIDPAGDSLAPGRDGEVMYAGPNVMMGYAEHVDDLALGDVFGAELATGDLGHLDADGFLYITGRTKRIAKVSGVRVSLDEIEQLVVGEGPVAAVPSGDDGVTVYCAWGDPEQHGAVGRRLCSQLGLPPRSVILTGIETIPLLASGKVDYQALQRP